MPVTFAYVKATYRSWVVNGSVLFSTVRYSVQLASMGEWYRIHTLHAYKKSYTYAVCYLMSNKVLFCSWFISLCIMTSFVTPSNWLPTSNLHRHSCSSPIFSTPCFQSRTCSHFHIEHVSMSRSYTNNPWIN